MRATATILGFSLLCVSLPVAAAQAAPADKAPSAKSESAKSEARVGSLAPDEARRAERARRRAAEKNAKAAAREPDHKMLEGKSVAAPDTAASTDKGSAATVMPTPDRKTVERRDVKPAQKTATQAPEAPGKAAAPVKAAAAPAAAPQPRDVAKDSLAKVDGRARDRADAEHGRSAERNARGYDRHDRRYASRHRTHRERFANDGSYRRAAPDEVIVEDGPPVALPPGAPPYPLRARGAREVYVVREVPAPPAAYGYGPRPFYSVRVPDFARGPDDDVE